MARPSVVVLDYGSGNVHSAAKALEAAGADVRLTADRAAVAAADGLLVPGVGAFDAVMRQLSAVRGGELIDRRLSGGRPDHVVVDRRDGGIPAGAEGGVEDPAGRVLPGRQGLAPGAKGGRAAGRGRATGGAASAGGEWPHGGLSGRVGPPRGGGCHTTRRRPGDVTDF